MTAAVVTLATVTIVIALLVIAWAVRALFFRDLGDHAAPRRDPPDDPPAYLPAPVPEFTYGPAPGTWPPPAGPVPAVWHDEYRPPQWWPARREPTGLDVTAAALLALAAVTAHLAAIEQARARAWRAEVLEPFGPWDRWPGDDTLTGMRAITDGGA